MTNQDQDREEALRELLQLVQECGARWCGAVGRANGDDPLSASARFETFEFVAKQIQSMLTSANFVADADVPETHIPFRPMESVHEALDRVGAPRYEDCDGPAGQRPLTPQQRIGWLQHRLRKSEAEITLLKHAMSSAAAHAIEAYNRLK